MITQVIWADVNNRELDTVYARTGDEEIREIRFIICRNDPPEKVEIPAGVSGQFRMVKSSGNFVVRDMTKTVQEDGTVIFTVAVSDQMVNVQGTGYYDIRLSGGGYLYTASGSFIVDTPVISSSVLEDVSEVNGLVFPDDFITTENHFAQINDNIISPNSTWSSAKINTLGFKGLDYDNIIDLTLPNKVGYDYTLPSNGVIIVSAYGSCAYTEITFNNIPYRIYHASDTWSSGTCIVNSGVVHLAMGATGGSYPAGSYLKFIPFKN